MLTALFADIHANREALAACMAHAERHRPGRIAFLGDMVGYGADPAWVIDTVMRQVERGAIAVLGNHDEAVVQGPGKHMSAGASAVATWTREQLQSPQLEFLAALPLTAEANGCLFVHASAAQPEQWEYVTGILEAIKSMHATQCRISFCGHVHQPALYNLSPTGKVSAFTPRGDSGIPLGSQRRWLAIPGSVGQPRDGNPAACYALFDDASHELTFFRVPYDHDTTAAKIRAAGLPAAFADRLERGE